MRQRMNNKLLWTVMHTVLVLYFLGMTVGLYYIGKIIGGLL